MTERRCSQCRAMVADIAAYCPRCGQRVAGTINATTPRTRPDGDANRPGPHEKSTVGIMVFGGIALTLAVIFAAYLALTIITPSRSVIPFSSPTVHSFPAPLIQVPQMSIKDGSGREITDPEFRAKIEAAIHADDHRR